MSDRATLSCCPFCGEPASTELSDDPDRWLRSSLFWVECSDDGCGAEGPTKSSAEEAIEAWNTRMTPGEGP